MSLAQKQAEQTRKYYHTNDPYQIASALNIDVLEARLAGRLKELYFGDHIILHTSLDEPEKRHYLAHALGHHFLHTGNYLFFQQHRLGQNDKEEQQAEAFAAHLLIPETELSARLDWNPADLANHFQVSPQLVNLRLQQLPTEDKNLYISNY